MYQMIEFVFVDPKDTIVTHSTGFLSGLNCFLGSSDIYEGHVPKLPPKLIEFLASAIKQRVEVARDQRAEAGRNAKKWFLICLNKLEAYHQLEEL